MPVLAVPAQQQAGPGVALLLGVCALVQAPVLAASLRRLLQNGSLLDIGLRRPLYLELSQLLRKLGARVGRLSCRLHTTAHCMENSSLEIQLIKGLLLAILDLPQSGLHTGTLV